MEFCIYTDDARNLYLSNGLLHIRPTLTEDTYGANFLRTELNLGRKCTGVKGTDNCNRTAFAYQILPPVLSAKITTKKTFSFQYGKVEVRAKLPTGDWIYPQMYLDPTEFAYGIGYNSGRLKIAYSAGNRVLGDTLDGGAILGESDKLRKYAVRTTESNTKHWAEDFHIYAIEWKPRKINLYVDNRMYGSVVPPVGGFASVVPKQVADIWKESLSPMAPFDKKMHLVLGVGVGGFSFADDDLTRSAQKPWKNKDPKGMLKFWQHRDQWHSTWKNNDGTDLQIDYVKVYAL